MPLFGKTQKSPAELVRQLSETLRRLSGDERKSEKLCEEASRLVGALRVQATDTAANEVVAQLSQEMYNTDVLLQLAIHLPSIDFEGKKDLVNLFVVICRRQIGTRHPTVDYLQSPPRLPFFQHLIRHYPEQELGLTCGSLLRECARQETLAQLILNLPEFDEFFVYVELPTFDIASDAFTTFKDLLVRHKTLVSSWLEQNYDRFFSRYSLLLQSENYVTKRQALKLLGEILLDRHNFNVMTNYISQPDNLKTIMKLLSNQSSRNIQFEAFHVFKVFVANPQKPRAVVDILVRNQERLVNFLVNFQNERSDDEQFIDEKHYLIKQIRELAPAAA